VFAPIEPVAEQHLEVFGAAGVFADSPEAIQCSNKAAIGKGNRL
jgi:hypothetical protein